MDLQHREVVVMEVGVPEVVHHPVEGLPRADELLVTDRAEVGGEVLSQACGVRHHQRHVIELRKGRQNLAAVAGNPGRCGWHRADQCQQRPVPRHPCDGKPGACRVGVSLRPARRDGDIVLGPHRIEEQRIELVTLSWLQQCVLQRVVRNGDQPVRTGHEVSYRVEVIRIIQAAQEEGIVRAYPVPVQPFGQG